MKALLSQHDGGALRRRLFFDAGVLLALLIAGALCGTAAHLWIGGLRAQHVQLERCIATTRQSHSNEDARSTLVHLDTDVPACMNAAGYESALNNQGCSPAFWQGDVFCYVPKSSLGKLIYRIEAASADKAIKGDSDRERSRRAAG